MTDAYFRAMLALDATYAQRMAAMTADAVSEFYGSQMPTLEQWEKDFTPQYTILPNGAARGIPDTPMNICPAARRALWSLSDYRVESVTGGMIWLAPKTKGTETK